MRKSKHQDGARNRSIFYIVENLQPVLNEQEIAYQQLCKKYNITEIANILKYELELNTKHQDGIYIEKQIPVPSNLIPFIP